MTLKERYRRFRAWQKEPQRYVDKGLDKHHLCANCGHEYEGRYCPVCGQAAGDGRVTWRSVWKNITLLWGIDSRSMIYTIWQLIWRPGYLIGEYIDGHRKASYPPVNMIFIIVVIYAVIKQVFGVSSPSVGLSGSDFVINLINWLISHPGWGMLAMTTLMILPTWMFFRNAPRHTRHTVPEGVFIQIFMSTLVFLVVILSRTVSSWFSLLIFFYNYITYRQLFGYSVFGTLWRVVMCFVMWTLQLLMFAGLLSFSVYGIDRVTLRTTIVIVVAMAVILTIGYLLDKKKRPPQKVEK